MPESKLTAKLLKAQQSVDAVQKRGKNQAQHYSYAMAEDVAKAGMKALQDQGLLCEFEATHIETAPREEGGSLITLVQGAIIVTDPETGESIRREVVGAGADKPGDKGAFKGMTGARKYALIHLLGIPIGDDPDDERGGTRRQQRKASEAKDELPKGKVQELVKLIGKSLMPAGAKGQLPQESFDKLGLMFGSISAERPAVNRGDSIAKALRGLTPEQGDQLATVLKGGD
jgi:hypothetical protein